MGDSDSEEELEVHIERGTQRESFSPEEANDAQSVQKRFSLEGAVACVYTAKSGKSVAFGKLRPGVIYKLKVDGDIPRQKDDEPDVYIEKADKRYAFSSAWANEAVRVQRMFLLDTEPACVYKVMTGERVAFGDLKPGFTYKLEDGGKIPNQQLHTQNAVMMANAVYQENPSPTEYLSSSSTHHTIYTVLAISQYSDQKLMLALGEVKEKKVLYVAFRGTKSWEDAMADADIKQRGRQDIPGGTFHSGFESRSRVLPAWQILNFAEREDCETIVVCGHSLGGAVAAVSATSLGIELKKQNKEISTYCITFGAPLFANETVRQYCQQQMFDQHMMHFVGYKDIVPGVLSLGHTISEAKRRSMSALNDATGERFSAK